MMMMMMMMMMSTTMTLLMKCTTHTFHKQELLMVKTCTIKWHANAFVWLDQRNYNRVLWSGITQTMLQHGSPYFNRAMNSFYWFSFAVYYSDILFRRTNMLATYNA
jgi:hypothetical protein